MEEREYMEPLVSDKQILEVIKKYQDENLTVRKLNDLLGYNSTGSVHHRLRSLERNGLIKRKIIRKTVIEVVKNKID